jgi:hypothetical protein
MLTPKPIKAMVATMEPRVLRFNIGRDYMLNHEHRHAKPCCCR